MTCPMITFLLCLKDHLQTHRLANHITLESVYSISVINKANININNNALVAMVSCLKQYVIKYVVTSCVGLLFSHCLSSMEIFTSLVDRELAVNGQVSGLREFQCNIEYLM